MDIIVGTSFTKCFEGHGVFRGEVVSKYGKAGTSSKNSEPLYKVKYEDGDEEDLSGSEVAAFIDQGAELTSSTKKRGAPSSPSGSAPKEDASKAKKTKSGGSVTSKVDADEILSGSAGKAMGKADALALSIRLSRPQSSAGGVEGSWEGLTPPTEADVTNVMLAMGNTWPTQQRPNVSDKAVQGMCLGMVNAFTAGLRVSLASKKCPEVSVTKLVNAFVKDSLPEQAPQYKYSSVQINYCYAAKRHVDGNNAGPSYIRSFGEHTGGLLWTADQGVINPKGKWAKFNGKQEHETQPFEGVRVSFILFTHNACEELTEDVVEDLKALGFTAGDSTRQRDPGNVEEKDFDAFFAAHREAHPPPVGPGMLAVECAGYACGRGAAWVSFDTGSKPPNLSSSSKKLSREAVVLETLEKLACNKNGNGDKNGKKAPTAAEKKVSLLGVSKADSETTWVGDSSSSSSSSSGGKGSSKGGSKGGGGGKQAGAAAATTTTVRVETFPKNRVGFHVVELRLPASSPYLELVAVRRFDLYNQTDQASADFLQWVESLPTGRVVVIAISDTAIAKKRPIGDQVYTALRLLGVAGDYNAGGGEGSMEVIGYRNPFVFIGAKGLPSGQAQMLIDKRAQSKTVLRLDARVVVAAAAKAKAAEANSGGSACPVALTEVTNSSISAREECPDREKEGVVFKNCTAVKR